MHRVRFIWIVLLTGFLGLATVSCFRSTTPPAPGIAGGVYEYSGYEYFHWQEGLDILVWHDAVASSGCDSSGSTSSETHLVQCQAMSKDGYEFFWQIGTNDGRTAEFSINNQSFDLADGTIFLVTTADGVMDIQQLQRDLSDIDHTNDQSITQFGQADPDISQFIQSTLPEE